MRRIKALIHLIAISKIVLRIKLKVSKDKVSQKKLASLVGASDNFK